MTKDEAPTAAFIGRLIVSKAIEFAGLTETANNRKWNDAKKTATIIEWMTSVGWQPGWPYCAAACEAVWRWAYREVGLEEWFLRELGSPVLGPHCMSMFRAASARGLITRLPANALPGAIAIWRNGSSDAGHAGIFRRWVDGGARPLMTIEANTGSGTESEGDGFYAKNRPWPDMGKLRFQGFINPIMPLTSKELD